MNSKKFPSPGKTPIVSQKPFSILVANFDEPTVGTKPGVKSRSEFTFSPTFSLSGTVPNGFHQGTLVSGDPFVNSTGEIEVTDNDFSTGKTAVFLGAYVFEAGYHFEVGGSATVTAANLATLIDSKYGYQASAAGPVVTVVGPANAGPVLFKAQSFGMVANYAINVSDGDFLVPGTPDLSGNVITG